MSPANPAGPTARVPAGSRDQVARLLMLVPYLHSRGDVAVEEAATALGTTPDQLVKDLRVLFMCGLPGGLPDDLIDVDLDAVQTEEGAARADGMIRVGNADYLARPLRLTATEASAVIVALRALRSDAEPETAAIVDRALAKLVGAASAGPVEAVVEEPADQAARDERARVTALEEVVRRAVADGRQLELDYYVPSRDEQSHRVVDPHAVLEEGAGTYLDAWCHLARAQRLFRIDRIVHAETLSSPVATTPAPPRDLAAGLVPAHESTLVTLRLEPAARWVTEYYPVQDVRAITDPTAPGAVEVDLLVADERWLTRLLMRLAPNASVKTPERYRTGFTAAVQDALALYPGPARTIGEVHNPADEAT